MKSEALTASMLHASCLNESMTPTSARCPTLPPPPTHLILNQLPSPAQVTPPRPPADRVPRPRHTPTPAPVNYALSNFRATERN